ncbi:MAG: purine-nucleoside phosphorylase [Syntrophobacteraceae bacterium]|nr:purine-nucleoside phosphorylase [Syntrophobacteraceae bacterium]
MEPFRNQVRKASDFISEHLRTVPEVGLILGTGLGRVVEEISEPVTIPYADIPYFPISTVESHRGLLLGGRWMEKGVLAMQGRFHLYEGYTPRQISFPVRVMKELGVRALILSNAAGGLNPCFQPGDLMLITDHINLTGHNPLVGPHVEEWGLRFPDMTQPYSRRLGAIALRSSLQEGLLLQRGVYVGVLGPSLETAAETRFLRGIGADAVGMSVIMEVITAVQAAMEVLGISVVTNVNLPDHYQPATIEDVIATAEKAGPQLARLLARVLPQV